MDTEDNPIHYIVSTNTSLKEVKHMHVMNALAANKWCVAKAADAISVPKRTIYDYIKRLREARK